MSKPTSSTSPEIASSSSSTSPEIPLSSSIQLRNTGTNDASNFIQTYTTDSIAVCLKYKKELYTIVNKKSNSSCWKVFGLPAKILGPKEYEIISKFASCKTCYQTYSYSSSTTTLSNHKCPMSTSTTQSKLQLLPVSKSLVSTPPVNSKLADKQKRSFITLMSDWICSNTRPISIVEDTGLMKVMDHCIQTGYSCGPIPASSLLPCRRTISKEIKRMAIVGRSKMKEILIGAARERHLSLSPDLWSDGYKKMSYLGCTAQALSSVSVSSNDM